MLSIYLYILPHALAEILGRSDILGLGGTKFCGQNLGQMINMATMLKNAQNAQKSSFSELVGRLSRSLVCSIRDLSPS